MAQKRMFDKSVIRRDEFMEMPDSSQNLYFHLSMDADDDGFVDNWKTIMRMTGKKEDDMKLLIAKQFIIPFENGVMVIKHWRLNNYLRKDRYVETKYLNEKSLLTIENNEEYSLGIPVVDTEENRVDKNSIEEYSIEPPIIHQEEETEILTDIDLMFKNFWEDYPKKKSKQEAYKSFKKIKPSRELLNIILEKIKLFKLTEDWQKNDGQYIPYPATWLNQKRWEDEITEKDLKKVTTKDLAKNYDWSDF